MTEAARAPRFPVGLTIAAAIAFLILVGLGTWQWQRMHWKEQLLARIAATQALPAQPLSQVLARAAVGFSGGWLLRRAALPAAEVA